jgi:broad specificity phosphatase PhoE
LATLLLVRHGQTQGFLTGDYTDLTPHGQLQAAALGAWLGAQGTTPELVAVGPAPRHRQTYEAAREAGGWAWPPAVTTPLLDEHAGMAVVLHALGGGTLPADLFDVFARAHDRREQLRAFHVLMAAWVQGRFAPPDAEPWAAFRARVVEGLDQLCRDAGKGTTILAFTSGGFVGAAVASVLGVADEQVALDLAFAVLNTSVTEVRFSGSRRGLHVFNATPHLGGDVAVTAI